MPAFQAGFVGSIPTIRTMEQAQDVTYQVKLLTDKHSRGKVYRAGEIVTVKRASGKSTDTVCLMADTRVMVFGKEYEMHFPEKDYWRLLMYAG